MYPEPQQHFRLSRLGFSLAIVQLLWGAMAVPHAHSQEAAPPAPLKVGIIGLDTSHVVAFTKIINGGDKGPLKNVRVVAAYPGGSPDLAISADRLEGFTNTLRDQYKVEIVDTIDELIKKVDAILLESVDGRVHLEQARPVLESGKPVFIDKPVAASLADTIEIFSLAKKHNCPCFTSSSLRFSEKLRGLSRNPEIGKLLQCDTSGPVKPLKGHPELFFYGIHGIEMLFTVMGSGCESVTWKDGVVRGVWDDGRIGTFRDGKYHARVRGSKGTAESGGGNYQSLVGEICKFFRTGKAPVPADETINLVAFMVAAEASKKTGGEAVTIPSVMKQARDEIKRKSR